MSSIDKIAELLGNEASLLEHRCQTVAKEQLHLPGPDFVDRVFVPTDTFPVTYRRSGKTAHLDVGGPRGDAILGALRDQLGLDGPGRRRAGGLRGAAALGQPQPAPREVTLPPPSHRGIRTSLRTRRLALPQPAGSQASRRSLHDLTL